MASKQCMPGVLRAFATILAIALAWPAAAAGLSYTTVYRDHAVPGTTPEAVWQYMVMHPIMDPDDGPALANITHEHTLTFTTATGGGACMVRDLSFTWHFVITLPKATDRARMSPATGSLWDEFLAKVTWHEMRRRAIFLDCGKAFVAAAAKITGPAGCEGVERKVRRFVDAQYDLCMKTQRDFGHEDSPLVAKLGLVTAAEAAMKAPAAH